MLLLKRKLPRTLCATMISSFTLNFFLSGVKGQWGTFYSMGLLNFGQFQCDNGNECQLWKVYDLGKPQLKDNPTLDDEI